MIDFKVTDLRRIDAFSNLSYRFARVLEDGERVILERDFLGENPLHWYVCGREEELIVASNICDIKEDLEQKGRTFSWERVRAVSNNKRVEFDNEAFNKASPYERELGPTLQEIPLDTSLDYSDFSQVGKRVRKLLDKSVQERLATIEDQRIGLLLSGGLDSMSVGYLLSLENREVTAFTLKVSDQDKDVVKSREIVKRCGIDLVEVGVDRVGDHVDLYLRDKYVESIPLEQIINESLRISGNPKKDNLFCAVAMYLVGRAVRSEAIKTVFCGEGPNEYVNDYGYNPLKLGYGTSDKGNIRFREALTFGEKEGDLQLGRGGLPKHATARMWKIFGSYGIRLEAPYFNREIAKIMTHIPHIPDYKDIKQNLMMHVLQGGGLDDLIAGTSKEKFQDGSGISRILESYTQSELVDRFEKIYGIRKTSYLSSCKVG